MLHYLRKFFGRRYNIGFVQNSLEGIMTGEDLVVNYLEHSFKDHWFADPFILDVTDSELKVLVEDYYQPIRRGQISLLTVDRKTMKLKRLIPILTLPTHLSYPIIWRTGGKVYMYPESGASKKLKLYELDLTKMKAIESATLAEGDLADATLTFLFGEPFMFATSNPCKDGRVLEIYKRDALSTHFVDKEEIVFNEVIARQAGDFFTYKGSVFRPAQESNNLYGHAVVLQQVSHTEKGWSFKEIRRLYSPSKTYPLGLHTFNMYKDVIVVDSVAYYHPLLAGMAHRIFNMVKRFVR